MIDNVGSAAVPPIASGIGQHGGARAPAEMPPSGKAAREASGADGGRAFDQILQQQVATAREAPPAPRAPPPAGVRFSAHAQERLAQAAVQLGPQALAKLAAAVDRAGQKGGKDSLILLDELAFVVSVKNRTVITAVGADRMNDSVFTKIDSVVFAKSDDAP